MKSNKKKSVWVHWRILLCGLLCVLPMILLLLRLWQVQVMHGTKYEELIRKQATRFIVTSPVRGQIYSADGKILAGNRCHCDLALKPSEMRTRGGYVTTSSFMLNIATFVEENLVYRHNDLDILSLRSAIKRNMAHPIVLYRDLTDDEIARCVEYTPALRGLEVTQRIEREYPFPGVATQLLGYTGWRNRPLQYTDEHGSRNTFNTRELLGNSGLEKEYDAILSGQAGLKIVLIDSLGFTREELPGSTNPVDGMDIVLTLKSQAQVAADEALAGHAGALVALDVDTGEILAMASAPTYNLAEFDGELFKTLLDEHGGHPMINRALSGKYMPGSIVKPLIALAALEKGVATEKSIYDCRGAFELGTVRIGCARRYGHGELDMVDALAASCNPYFIDLGLHLGMEELQKAYSSVGFGAPVECGIRTSQAGTIPSNETALRLWQRKWLPIDTAYAAIGQGGIEVTPLQAAVYAAALANGGRLLSPHILRHIARKDGQIVQVMRTETRGILPFSAKNLDIVWRGMARDVTDDDASASALQELEFPVAAKTGTAEVGYGEKRHKNTWLICFGPLPRPRFAVACIIEHGESGGKTAAPVVLNFLSNAGL